MSLHKINQALGFILKVRELSALIVLELTKAHF